jgi:hypothetical protein
MSERNGSGRTDYLPAPSATSLAREIRAALSGVPRKALRLEEASQSLGVSPDFFREHVAPDLKVVRKGRVRLIPVAELDKWIQENACHIFSSPPGE